MLEVSYGSIELKELSLLALGKLAGVIPPVVTRFLVGETKVEAVQREQLLDRDEALSQLKHHLLRAQG